MMVMKALIRFIILSQRTGELLGHHQYRSTTVRQVRGMELLYLLMAMMLFQLG